MYTGPKITIKRYRQWESRRWRRIRVASRAWEREREVVGTAQSAAQNSLRRKTTQYKKLKCVL